MPHCKNPKPGGTARSYLASLGMERYYCFETDEEARRNELYALRGDVGCRRNFLISSGQVIGLRANRFRKWFLVLVGSLL